MTDRKRETYLRLIRESVRPMEPSTPPELPPALAERCYSGGGAQAFSSIRAVAFDVYGTLFTSAAGDIASGSDYARGNLDALALQFAEDTTGEELKFFFRKAVMEAHGALYEKTPYPEVRVEELWASLPRRYSDRDPGELALRYELAVNPVAPMPGAEACISALGRADLPLGIVTNAQFFTPLLFEACFGFPPEDLGFLPELCVYSHKLLRAKPSPDLFAPLVRSLSGRGIRADECLYIGNDMLNDIYGAADSGIKTALFAGDGRSLRLREGNRLCEDLLPDVVLKELRLIPALLGLQVRHD